jgi:hypothetical protein
MVTDRSKVRSDVACKPLCCLSNSTDWMWSYGISSGLKVYRNARSRGYKMPEKMNKYMNRHTGSSHAEDSEWPETIVREPEQLSGLMAYLIQSCA